MNKTTGCGDISHWEYRGEGNASLVIAHQKDHRILKLSKCLAEPSSAKDSIATNSREDLKQQIQYVMSVLKPMLGGYVCLPELVAVNPEFLQAINNKCNELRPKERLHKKVDSQCSHAVSLPDLSFLHPVQDEWDSPTFCVEIKPKMGFLPISPCISSNKEVKKTVCRYCLLQRLKIKHGTWTNVSKYCPIDLFSGNINRMKHALHQLLENPQNNLRIFKNGKPLYAAQGKDKTTNDDKMELHQNLKDFFGAYNAEQETLCKDPLRSPVLESFLDVVIKVLLHLKEDLPIDQCRRNLPVQVCRASCFDAKVAKNEGSQTISQLPPGCVLDSLLQTQMLDDLDIEGIFPLYQKVRNAMETGVSDRKEYQLDWPFDEKDFYQRQMMLGSDKPTVTPDNLDTVTMDTAVHKIRCFLVSGTAKDCSILLAIQPTRAKDRKWKHPYSCNQGNSTYLHSCHIIDLDTKPASRIPKYYKLDEEIVNHFNSTQM